MSEDVNTLIAKAARRDTLTRGVLAAHEDCVARAKERAEGFSLDATVAGQAFSAPNRQLRKDVLDAYRGDE